MQSTESTELECNKPESFKIVGLATVGPCHLEVHSFRTLVTWLSPNLQKKHICASFPTNSITQSEFLRLATKHSLSQSQSLKIYTVPLCCHRLWYQCQQAKEFQLKKRRLSYTKQPRSLSVAVSFLVLWG